MPLTRRLALPWIAALALLGACEPGEPAPDPPDGPGGALAPCGVADATVPDFTLEDVNPRSPTYGRAVSLADHAGQVVVLHWMWGT